MNERTTGAQKNSTGRMCGVRTVGSRTGLWNLERKGPRREIRRRGYRGERVFQLHRLRTSGGQEFQIENFKFQMKATGRRQGETPAVRNAEVQTKEEAAALKGGAVIAKATSKTPAGGQRYKGEPYSVASRSRFSIMASRASWALSRCEWRSVVWVWSFWSWVSWSSSCWV